MARPWPEVVQPHPDVLRGGLDESVFAADLEDVRQGRAPSDYLYPEEFFAKTYPTDGLVRLLASVLRRLAGHGGDPVINLQTPFGGGKTHALIALYHLCTAGEQAQGNDLVERALAEAGLDRLPACRLAVFVGTSPDPLHDKTPWGAIADQLGHYASVEQADRERIAPGKEKLLAILGDTPTLILLDELAVYGVAAQSFRGQLLAFLQELTEAVKVSRHAALVASLPSSAPYGEEGERVLHQMEMVLGRTEVQYELVQGEEIYEVVRRRLFQKLGSNAEQERAVRAYWELYQSLGDDVPDYAREPRYQARMLKAYPFHPEIIDILFERWSTFSTFQRTRGTLRLLGEVVATLYQTHHPSPLIQPAHLDLGNDQIRRELVKHIGNEYNAVIAADITGPTAKATRLDQEMGTEYARYRVATGLATAIFFGSFSGAERRGVTLPWLRLATLRPGIPAPLIGDAINRLEDELWYLHAEQGRYWFTNQPNLNRIRIEREEAVQEVEIQEELEKMARQLAGNEFQTFVWPRSPQDVPDTKELKLAVLAPEQAYPQQATVDFVRTLLERTGNTFRTYPNTLVVVAPNAQELNALRGKLRRLLALRGICSDTTLLRQLSEENRRKLESDLKGLQDGIAFDVRTTYRHLAKASGSGIDWWDLGLPTVGQTGSLARRVREYLRETELLVEKLGPDQLMDKAFRPGEQEKRLGEVKELFLRYPHLPMLNRPQVIDEAVQAGVHKGVFGLQVGERIYFREAVPASVFDDEAILLRPEVAAERIGPPVPPPPPPPPTDGDEDTDDGAPPPVVAGIQKVSLTVELPWGKLADFMRGVIIPLHNDGAEVRLVVSLEARSPGGSIRSITLEHTVRETLKQLGVRVIDERVE